MLPISEFRDNKSEILYGFATILKKKKKKEEEEEEKEVIHGTLNVQ